MAIWVFATVCDWLHVIGPELDIREIKILRPSRLLHGKSHFKMEFCRRVDLVGANCFYANTENERFTVAGSRCRQKT